MLIKGTIDMTPKGGGHLQVGGWPIIFALKDEDLCKEAEEKTCQAKGVNG